MDDAKLWIKIPVGSHFKFTSSMATFSYFPQSDLSALCLNDYRSVAIADSLARRCETKYTILFDLKCML